MEATLEAMAEDDPPFALCLVDLAHFKLLNDSRGYEAGDALLRAVAKRLVDHAPDGALVGRVEADEFGVAGPPGMPPDELARIVAAGLSAPFALGEMEHVLRWNMGTVTSAMSAEGCLILNAGIAMHAAKVAGSSRSSTGPRCASARRSACRPSRAAGRHPGGPAARVLPAGRVAEDRTIVSMEALVRWQHPEQGLVPPGRSSRSREVRPHLRPGRVRPRRGHPAAGGVARGGRRGPRRERRRQRRGPPVQPPGFTALVERALATAGLLDRPELLGLEVTETMLVEASPADEDVFGALSALGVRLLLDDFGTGVSSLSRLKRLPVDTLKIDRAFIVGLGQRRRRTRRSSTPSSRWPASSTSRSSPRASRPRPSCAARRLGCSRVQGFAFSRPLPAGEMKAFLAGQGPGDGLSGPPARFVRRTDQERGHAETPAPKRVGRTPWSDVVGAT
jgi:diguanylate cyclase (GGDEF)-like protein